MHTGQKPRVGDPTSSCLIHPQKSVPTDLYRPALALIFGALVGVLLGAAMMLWWFSSTLSEAQEMVSYSAIYVDAAKIGIKAAIGLAAILAGTAMLEIYRAKKSFKATSTGIAH